ncbi:MAG: T9SS type A sorting domain-containing protein [Rhodothermaceae bacterium]|nr:T9SS type A sorting domain-containing protein [Rhodothermaceae bacterium]
MRQICLTLTLLLMCSTAAWGQEPNWSVDPAGYSSTMSVVGTLDVDGVPTSSEQDLVAAFVGNEVRGVARPVQSNGVYLYVLTIHANTAGETVSLKSFLHDERAVVDITEFFSFEVNGVLGTPNNPVPWSATRGVGACASAPPEWSIDASQYSSNMTLTAGVSLENGLLPVEHDILAAFVGEEVRGIASPTGVNGEKLFFLTIHGNINGEVLSLRFYNSQIRAILSVSESLAFEANRAIGTVVSPASFSTLCAVEATSIEEVEPVSTYLNSSAYPNPFNHQATIQYHVNAPSHVTIEMYDLLGRHIEQLVNAQHSSGHHKAYWTPDALPAGIYLYNIQIGSKSETRQVVYLK